MGSHQHLDSIEPIADFLGANEETGMNGSQSDVRNCETFRPDSRK